MATIGIVTVLEIPADHTPGMPAMTGFGWPDIKPFFWLVDQGAVGTNMHLGLLQSKRDWSSLALADKLGVSDRTIRRDIDTLRARRSWPSCSTSPASRVCGGQDVPCTMLDWWLGNPSEVGLARGSGSGAWACWSTVRQAYRFARGCCWWWPASQY